MTAQTPEVKNVLKAYVFLVTHGQGSIDDVGSIAGSIEEALADLRRQYADFPHPETITLFDIAVARMQPGLIEWYDWQNNKRYEGKGLYAFLKGMFFCQCGDHQEATRCAKYEDGRGRLTATIYHGDHYVRPL